MKNKFLFVIAALFTTAIFSGCEKDDPEIEMTKAGIMSGTWYVTYNLQNPDGSFEDVSGGHIKLTTYNTAANTASEIWVTDEDPGETVPYTFWNYKVRANVDMGNKSFNANQKSIAMDGEDLYDINVNIMDGMVFEKGGRSRSGVQVDSIAFKIKFEDDPDNLTYHVMGHRRTGFEEDEYAH